MCLSMRSTTKSPDEPEPQEDEPRKLKRLKKKIYQLMQQSLYSAQERLWPVAIILKKYEHLSPFRMSFIFGQLELLTHEGHSIIQYLERKREHAPISEIQRLQVYWQLVRRNIDVTYLVDYIKERVPQDEVALLRQRVLRKEQEDIKKMLIQGRI